MTGASEPTPTALVVGVSGISGQAMARQLVHTGYRTFGLSSSGSTPTAEVAAVRADLLDPVSLASALSGVAPEFVAITAWRRQDTEAENIAVNGAIVRHILDALRPHHSVRHVSLVTGLKHYLGPFEAYGKAVMAETPFHESEPRLPFPNFYYAQEDELFAAAEQDGFTWSVHRAHTVFGFAAGNAMNMALTLSVYAEICRAQRMPFIFPGSEQQWNGLTDITDADLLAEQMLWAAGSPAGHDQAFNIANGDVFRWRWLWPQIADHFGVAWEGFDRTTRPLESRMTDAASVWSEIAERHGLVEKDVARLASWWHTDADLGRSIECLTDMTKSRKAGFLGFRSTPDSFFGNVQRYRDAELLPRLGG